MTIRPGWSWSGGVLWQMNREVSMARRNPRGTRTSLYFDEEIWANLERIAGPFGEPSRVVAVALRDGRAFGEPSATGQLTRQAQIRIHPVTRARLDALAAEHQVTWQAIARYIVVQWIAGHDLGKVPNRQAG